MQMTFNKRIGDTMYNFVVEGKNLHELQMEAQKMSFRDVYSCGLCKSERLYLRAYVTEKENFKYVLVCCAECKAHITFGQQTKDPDVFYLRRNEDHSYKWEEFKESDKAVAR